MPCAACGTVLGSEYPPEESPPADRGSGRGAGAGAAVEEPWEEEEPPSVRLVRAALPIDGVLLRDADGAQLMLGLPSQSQQESVSEGRRPTPSPSGAPGQPRSAAEVVLAAAIPTISVEGVARPPPNGRRSGASGSSAPPSSTTSEPRSQRPSVGPSRRPDSRSPSSRVAMLLNLPPPGFDGPEVDVVLPVEMPADFVVKDVDGTMRAERPKPRHTPAVPPRANRRQGKPDAGPAFRLPLEFWLVVLLLALVALFFIARLYAV